MGERYRYGSLCRVPLHPTPGICIGILESPAALSDDTHLPPIDERCGITSKARDQPPTPFLDTISPEFGVLLRRWRGHESRSFPKVGFLARVRIHLSPAASPLRTRPPSPIATGTDPLVRVPARWYDADQQWICSSNIDVDDLSKAIAFYLQAAGLRLGRRFGSLGLEMLGTSSTIYPRAKPDGTTASWR